MPEDRALVESLYRVADRMKREREEDIHDIVRGRPVLKLQQIKRDIAKEVEGVNGGSGAVGVKARQ